MKQLNFKSHRAGITTPCVRLGLSGHISMSGALLELIGAKAGDSVAITEDDDDVFISKSKNGGGILFATQKAAALLVSNAKHLYFISKTNLISHSMRRKTRAFFSMSRRLHTKEALPPMGASITGSSQNSQ